MVEAWALRIAIGMVLDLKISLVIVESECEMLVKCVKGLSSSPWKCDALVSYIVDLMSLVLGISLESIGRDANKAADWHAKGGLSWGCVLWIGLFNPILFSLYFVSWCWFGCYRYRLKFAFCCIFVLLAWLIGVCILFYFLIISYLFW